MEWKDFRMRTNIVLHLIYKGEKLNDQIVYELAQQEYEQKFRTYHHKFNQPSSQKWPPSQVHDLTSSTIQPPNTVNIELNPNTPPTTKTIEYMLVPFDTSASNSNHYATAPTAQSKPIDPASPLLNFNRSPSTPPFD